MSEAPKYAIVLERTSDGYGAYVPDLPGCVAVGDTLAEADALIREAIVLHVALMRESGEQIPLPTTFTGYVEIPVAVGF